MIRYAITSTRSRRAQADTLAGEVGATVFEDDTTLGERKNHHRAWSWLANLDAEWLCVLQDDALPVDDFLAQAELAVENLPTEGLISLYLSTSYPMHIQAGVT